MYLPSPIHSVWKNIYFISSIKISTLLDTDNFLFPLEKE